MESGYEEVEPKSACARCRGSKVILIIIVFFGLLADHLLLTLIDPILPDILARVENVSRSDDLSASPINSNGRFGFLIAAKGFAQFLFNPFVGYLIARFGYRKPMLLGAIVLFASTVAFGFSQNYAMFFVTRLCQGASSSITAVTGLGVLAASYVDDQQRGRVLGLAFAGLSFGAISGPIYGSIMYQFFGQEMPFLILGGIILITIILQIITLGNGEEHKAESHSLLATLKLLIDPYIFIVAVNIFLVNISIFTCLAFLPMRLIELENAPAWKLGLVVLPPGVTYLFANIIIPYVHRCVPRWLCAMLGMLLCAGSTIALAFNTGFAFMMVGTALLGWAIGMVSSSMQPEFGRLVDLRYESNYSGVYAVSDMAVCSSSFLGPLVGGPVVYAVGFIWMFFGMGIVIGCFAPFSWLLRNPPPKASKAMKEPSTEKSHLVIPSDRHADYTR